MVWLRPLQNKCSAEVAYELDLIFSFIGYPLILHTDNGPEFMGAVAELIRQINPLSTLVRGRSRHPQDQGSVENANKGIKNVITKMVLEK